MIPLNKPLIKKHKGISLQKFQEFKTDNFQAYNEHVYYSARDGLNAIYHQLYVRYGSLQIAVSPLTCYIALYPIVANGHIPYFVDVDPSTFNIDLSTLDSADFDAIQVIHLGGNPAKMDEISSYAKKHHLIIIEDCAQALGSYYQNQHVGSFGDYSVFSLIKNLLTPVGGLLFSKNEFSDLNEVKVSPIVIQYKYIKRFLESKVSYTPNLYTWLYNLLLSIKAEQDSSSFNTSLKCIDKPLCKNVLSVFSSLGQLSDRRRQNAQLCIENIDPNKYLSQKVYPLAQSNWNRILLYSKNKPAIQVITELRNNGIAANNLTQNYLNGYQEHISKDSLLSKFYTHKLDTYELIYPKLVAIPSSPCLSDRELKYILNIINKI